MPLERLRGLKDSLHEYVFVGGIKKGGTWGGPTCAAYLPFQSHILEIAIWISICLVLDGIFNFRGLCRDLVRKGGSIVGGYTPSNLSRTLDRAFAFVHLAMWFQVLCYKVNLRSLVNLLQPCHLVLLGLGISISLGGPKGAVLGLALLPTTLLGALAALAVPATTGLDQPLEYESFFIQHYLLLLTPLYLLLRDNGIACRVFNFRVMMFANWVSLILHWFLIVPMDRYFQVNVNFFLCPSEGMVEAFEGLPRWLLQPTYRTTLTTVFFLAGIVVTYSYVFFASLFLSHKETIKSYCASGKSSGKQSNKEY